MFKFNYPSTLFSLIVLLCFTSSPLSAQDEGGWDWDAIPYGYKGSFTEFHGVGDFHFIKAQEEGENKGISSFYFHTFHFFIRSSITENIDISVDVEWENGLSQPKGDRIELRWKFTDWFKLVLGKFYMPIGIEQETHLASAREFVTTSLGYRNIIPGTYSDYGIKLQGELKKNRMRLDYSFAVVNGLGDSAATSIRDSRPDKYGMKDNNDNKMFVGRIRFYPNQHFNIGGSFATGKYDAAGKYSINYLTAHGAYYNKRLLLKTQYTLNGVENAVQNFTRSGWFVLGAYKVFTVEEAGRYVALLARYEQINEDDRVIDNKDVSRITLGLTVSPVPHLLVKLNYEIIDEKVNELKDNIFRLQAVIDF